jgi:hypothetical protein
MSKRRIRVASRVRPFWTISPKFSPIPQILRHASKSASSKWCRSISPTSKIRSTRWSGFLPCIKVALHCSRAPVPSTLDHSLVLFNRSNLDLGAAPWSLAWESCVFCWWPEVEMKSPFAQPEKQSGKRQSCKGN